MQRELIRKRIVELVGDMSIEAYDNINKVRIFSYLFDEIGLGYFFNRGKKGYELAIEASEEPLTEERNKIIEYVSTVDNIIAAFDGIKFQIHASEMYVVGDNIVIRINSNISNERKIEGIDVATNRDDLETIGKLIESSLVIKESLNDENSYKIAYKGQYSIETTVCKFNDWETNLKKNYNDDLPYDSMNDVIRSDKAGLIMFYGIPGTGKTSLVKTLINDNRDTDFIFVDTSVCESISDGLFLDFLQEHKNSVIVFEDCEKLLFSRDEMVNESIGTILNLTDGIIAESMKIKFICTFNCDLEKVDKALLRKGRLSIGYEFKKLSLEKTKAIYPDAKEEMTLADAHNASVNNGYEEKKRKSIGFH
jgi:ATP-dependent 26S proteasome regulatory subunit